MLLDFDGFNNYRHRLVEQFERARPCPSEPLLLCNTVNAASQASARYSASIIALLTTIALTLLWFRQKSLLNLWLMVVMLVFMTEVLIGSFPVSTRFSAGMPGAPAACCPAGSFSSRCAAV